MTATIRHLTVEMHLVQSTEDACRAYAAAAKAPRWSMRRWLLTRQACAHDREALMWEEELFAEARRAEWHIGAVEEEHA